MQVFVIIQSRANALLISVGEQKILAYLCLAKVALVVQENSYTYKQMEQARRF